MTDGIRLIVIAEDQGNASLTDTSLVSISIVGDFLFCQNFAKNYAFKKKQF